MSTVAEPASEQRAGEREHCERCGAPLAAEQEWCHDCGAARTRILRPPDWRIAAVIVVGVVILALAAFAVVLVNLSSEANRSAQTIAGATTSTTSTTAASAPASRHALASWPARRSGWTVVLFASSDRASADAAAQRIAGTGVAIGVLGSSQHPGSSIKAGRFVVFAGRFGSEAAAQSRAAQLASSGPTAYHPRVRRIAAAAH